jgi:TusE/DsrC/DsvC family sulfur relay protein
MTTALAGRSAAAAAAGLPLDADGFLLDHRLWDRSMAQRLADWCGVGPLGETQWLIIDFVRDRYFRLGALPPMRSLCRKVGVERRAMMDAFGSCRVLWQVAGLPNPGCEAVAYLN